MEGFVKIFKVVYFLAMVLTVMAAVLSMIGIVITGFYPGIIVLLLLTLIPVASNFNAKKIISKSSSFQRNYYIILTIVNLLTMLVVLWMIFVIVIDRVFPNI